MDDDGSNPPVNKYYGSVTKPPLLIELLDIHYTPKLILYLIAKDAKRIKPYSVRLLRVSVT